jgi:hypothetical protein
MADWIFTFFHLGLILGVIGYAIVSLFQGNIPRFAFILAGMVLYYFVVLHKPVKNELARRRSLKKGP